MILGKLVPRAGIEPAHLAVRDFKSLVSTISPPGLTHGLYIFSFFLNLFEDSKNSKSCFQLLHYLKKCRNIII